MIVVSVYLLSAVTHTGSELARMTVDNIGGTATRGDYRTSTLRGRSQEALHSAMLNDKIQREGRVLNHARQQEHVWNLVAKGLTGMGYGGKEAIAPDLPPPLAEDVCRLVVAGRELMDADAIRPGEERDAFFRELEKFASRVCYDDDGGSIPEAHADPCTCGGDGH